MKNKPVLTLLIVVVLLGAAGWLFARHVRSKPVAQPVPVRCEACGYEFVPAPGETDPVCPKCGASVHLRLIYFRCRTCGETFVAYEADPGKQLYRVPGGEWMPRMECDFLPTCPKCGSKDTYFVKNPGAPATKPAGGD